MDHLNGPGGENKVGTQCSGHRELCSNVKDVMLRQERLEEKSTRADNRLEILEEEIFTNPTSLRSRVKGTEDGMSGLKEMVLENRKIVGDSFINLEKNFDEKMKGFFKIFILTISACFILVTAVFGVIWHEVKVNEAETTQMTIDGQQGKG